MRELRRFSTPPVSEKIPPPYGAAGREAVIIWAGEIAKREGSGTISATQLSMLEFVIVKRASPKADPVKAPVYR